MVRVTVTRLKQQEAAAVEEPKEVPEVELKAVGPKSEKVLPEVERLKEAKAKQEAEVERLAAEVQERQAKLDTARAAGTIGKVDAKKVAAFEKELAGLQKELSEAAAYAAIPPL